MTTDLRPLLDIHALGTPRPKGSLRPIVVKPKPGAEQGKAHVVMKEQLAGSPDWRAAVNGAAFTAIRCDCPEPDCQALKPGYPYTGAVKVLVELRFTPPAKPKDPLPKSRTTGDVDKHARNILDALQDAGVVKDDAQVCDLRVTKRYAAGEPAGARIVVWPAAGADLFSPTSPSMKEEPR